MDGLSTNLLHTKFGYFSEVEIERVWEPVDGQKSYRILTSAHSVVVLCINLQHPHIPAIDQDKNSSMNGKEGSKLHLYWRRYWHWWLMREEELLSFAVWLLLGFPCPSRWPPPNQCVHGLRRLFIIKTKRKREHEVGIEMGWGTRRS